MSEGKYIEQLLKKASTSPPVMSLSEVNELVKRSSRVKVREKQWYIPIGLMVMMLFLSWYMYTPNAGPAKRVPRWTPPDVKLMTFSIPTPEQMPAQKQILVEPAQRKSQATLVKKQAPVSQSAMMTPVMKDTLKHKTNSQGKSIVVKYSEMMIPWYADQEALKIYINKLASEGITLNVVEVRYGDKAQKGPKTPGDKITYLRGELFVNNSHYKTIELTNFKEIRIGWETDNAGSIRIKSFHYLDRNYMKRKL